VNSIANVTSGVVTATVTHAAASVLAAALTNTADTDVLTLTVDAEVAGATAAADLKALNADTNQQIAVGNGVTAVSGSFADVNDVLCHERC